MPFAGIHPDPISDLEAFLQVHWPQGEFNWSLCFGTVLAFLSQLSTIGKGLQKVGVQSLPELSCRPAVLRQYISSKTWRNGMMLDCMGAVFGFISLTVLPISVAQPIFCNGLVLLACYSHFYLNEHVGRREWIAIGMCFFGSVLLAATLVPRDWTNTHVGWLQVKMTFVVLCVFPSLILFEVGIRRAKRNRGVPNRAIIELLTGMQAGVCIGVGNASLASGLQSTSRSWLDHVAKEQVPGFDRSHQPWAPCGPLAHRPWAPRDHCLAPRDHCLAGGQRRFPGEHVALQRRLAPLGMRRRLRRGWRRPQRDPSCFRQQVTLTLTLTLIRTRTRTRTLIPNPNPSRLDQQGLSARPRRHDLDTLGSCVDVHGRVRGHWRAR